MWSAASDEYRVSIIASLELRNLSGSLLITHTSFMLYGKWASSKYMRIYFRWQCVRRQMSVMSIVASIIAHNFPTSHSAYRHSFWTVKSSDICCARSARFGSRVFSRRNHPFERTSRVNNASRRNFASIKFDEKSINSDEPHTHRHTHGTMYSKQKYLRKRNRFYQSPFGENALFVYTLSGVQTSDWQCLREITCRNGSTIFVI